MTQLELSRRWLAFGMGAYASALVLVVSLRIEAAPAGTAALLTCLGAATVVLATLGEKHDLEARWTVRALVVGLGALFAVRLFTAAAFSEDLQRFALKIALGVVIYAVAYWLLKRWI